MTAEVHSLVGPSGAALRIQCTASVTLQQRPGALPDDGKDAAPGNAAHWVAAQMLTGQPEPAVNSQAPNGEFVTDEMLEGADLYVGYITRVLAAHGMTPADGAIEVPLDIPRVHDLAYGTPDFRAWLPTAPYPTLFLPDYKFGHGVVEVYQNPQLVEYVAGAIGQTRLNDLQVNVITAIVQPRAFHRDGPIREWKFNAADIRALVNIGSNAAHEALGPNPIARTGPECKHCRARHQCTTLQRAAQGAMDFAEKPQPFDLDPVALGIELRMIRDALARLEARATGLETQALARLKQGAAMPGWAIEHGTGRQRWARPDAAVLTMGQMMGFDLARPPEPITPRQAVKIGFPLDSMPHLVETPRSAAKLVPDDTTRAGRVFG